MIKGVNKRVIEINSTDSEYFEKAVLYVRPNSAELPPKLLNEEADMFLERIAGENRRRHSLSTAEAAGISAAAAAVLTTIIMILLLSV